MSRFIYAWSLPRPDGSEATGRCSLDSPAKVGDCIRVARREFAAACRIVRIEDDYTLRLERIGEPEPPAANPGNAAFRLLAKQPGPSEALAATFCV